MTDEVLRTQRFAPASRKYGGAMLLDLRDLGGQHGPVRTLADMSESEIQALERMYGCPVQRPTGPRVMVAIGSVIVSTTREQARKMVARRQRDRAWGTMLDRRCRCGHALGDHFPWAPYACDRCDPEYPCEAFAPHAQPADGCGRVARRHRLDDQNAQPRAARERKRRT